MHAHAAYSRLSLVAIVCLWPTGTRAQDDLTSRATNVIARASGASREAVAGPWVSATSEVAPDDLAARVKRLEEALQEAENKAQREKTQAAGKPLVELNGRVHFDHVFNRQDALNRQIFGNAPNGTEPRTLRLKAQGNVWESMNYRVELDFASSAAVFKDIYIGAGELPLVGNVRVGRFPEPMGMEGLGNTNYLTFMERNTGRDAFLPIRDTGVMFFDCSEEQNVTWQAGMFDTDIPDNPSTRIADGLPQSFTGRVTWLPWYDECSEGRGLLHTGVAYSYRHPNHHTRTFSTRVDEHIGIRYIDTGALSLGDYQVVGLEAAAVYGPLSVQSECFLVQAEPAAAGASEMTFTSFYVTVSYFLTGEHRRYRRDMALFDRVMPFEDFFRVEAGDGGVYTGKGAWEVAFRHDYIDVGDAGPTAGMCAAQTYGVNWYLNPYTRVMWNYVHADTHKYYADAGRLDAFLMRFQIDF